MQEKFVAAWLKNRQQAQALGIRLRPVAQQDAMQQAYRALSGSRSSDGFGALAEKGRLDLSLEALVIDKRYTALFSDEQANTALTRLLEMGYSF